MSSFEITVARAVHVVKAVSLLAVACERGSDTLVVPPDPVVSDVARAEPMRSPAELWAEVGALRKRALVAQGTNAWSDAIAGWRAVLELVPDHAGMRFNLACALAQSGDSAAALDELEAVARMGVAMPLELDSDLESLRGDLRWRPLVATMVRAQNPGGARHMRSVVQVEGFEAEGLAWDPTRARLLLGGIVGQSIIAVTGAKAEPFATPLPTCSVFGVAIDVQRERVWATCSAVPQGRTRPEREGWAALLSFDLDGTPRERLVLDDGRVHLLGDLAIADNGVVFATDTIGGSVVASDGKALRVVIEPGTLPSPQGIAVLGETLVVADYAMGLVRIADERVTLLAAPVDTTLRGIDGLARRGNTLVAVQNGVVPPRILRIDLGADAQRIERVTTLLVPDPVDGEPTLATTHGDTLRIMLTDRWDRVFDKEGRPRQGVTITSPVILQLQWPR